MSRWFSRPGDTPQVWHLEAILPSARYLVFAACGLRWAPTEADPLEYTEDVDQVRYEVRCAVCNDAFARRRTDTGRA